MITKALYHKMSLLKTYDILNEAKGSVILVEGKSMTHSMNDVLRDLTFVLFQTTSKREMDAFHFKIHSVQDRQHNDVMMLISKYVSPCLLVLHFENSDMLHAMDNCSSVDSMLFLRELKQFVQMCSQAHKKRCFLLVKNGFAPLCLRQLATTIVSFDKDECNVTPLNRN